MIDDARLLELSWLAQLEQSPARSFAGYPTDCPERRLLLHLLAEGHAIDHGSEPVTGARSANADVVRRHAKHARWTALTAVMQGHPITLSITHAGAVRRAELEQRLKQHRARDGSGVVWDGRHAGQDAAIALCGASGARPLAVLHASLVGAGATDGSEPPRRYLALAADLAGDRGDAYRATAASGDVLALLPATGLDEALARARAFLAGLGAANLRAAAGLVLATDPGEPVDRLRARAAAEHQRAALLAPTTGASVVAWPPDHHATVPSCPT